MLDRALAFQGAAMLSFRLRCPPIAHVLLALLPWIAWVLGAPAKADECQDNGKILAMLRDVEKSCTGYRLTPAASKYLSSMEGKLGQFAAQCVADGREIALKDLRGLFPALNLAVNRPPMSAPLCDAIAEYLTAFCFVTGHEPLVAQAKRRPSTKP
jgi:hypothetical protein